MKLLLGELKEIKGGSHCKNAKKKDGKEINVEAKASQSEGERKREE